LKLITAWLVCSDLDLVWRLNKSVANYWQHYE
jgi:hypothetical protein